MVYRVSAKTLSSTTTTATSLFATGSPWWSVTSIATLVSPPGVRVFSAASADTVSFRDSVETERLMLPAANAGRFARPGAGSPSIAGRTGIRRRAEFSSSIAMVGASPVSEMTTPSVEAAMFEWKASHFVSLA